jgi:hypothetical protein
MCHRDGSLKKAVASNPEKYIHHVGHSGGKAAWMCVATGFTLVLHTCPPGCVHACVGQSLMKAFTYPLTCCSVSPSPSSGPPAEGRPVHPEEGRAAPVPGHQLAVGLHECGDELPAGWANVSQTNLLCLYSNRGNVTDQILISTSSQHMGPKQSEHGGIVCPGQLGTPCSMVPVISDRQLPCSMPPAGVLPRQQNGCGTLMWWLWGVVSPTSSTPAASSSLWTPRQVGACQVHAADGDRAVHCMHPSRLSGSGTSSS